MAPAPPATRRPLPGPATEAVHGYAERLPAVSGFGLPLFLGVALAFPLIVYAVQGGLNKSRYWVDLGILILTYVMLGWGLNIVVGLAGLLDLGYVAFYAVGAYSYALLSTTFGLSFWICLPLAGMLAAFWGILLGFPVLRLRGDYLAIVTLAFGEIIRLVLINWVDLTNGGAGISSIPRVTFFGIPFTAGDNGFAAKFGLEFDAMHRSIFLYYLILALALLTNYVTMRLRRLPVGRAWEALREDEIACRSLGINTTNTKLTAFALGAMFGGFAGSFFAVAAGLRHARRASTSWNRRSSWRSSCWAAWARRSASPSPPSPGRRPGDAAQSRLPQSGVRRGLRSERVPPAAVRPRHGAMMVWRPRGLISSASPR